MSDGLTNELTSSMEQSPFWEANRFSASQEIPHILWNPNVHYRIHKSPPPIPTPSQINQVHGPSSHFLKIHFNSILIPMLGSSTWSPSLRYPPPKPCMHLSFTPYVLYAPPITFVSIWFPGQYLVSSTDLETNYVRISFFTVHSIFFQSTTQVVCTMSRHCV